MRKHQAWIGKKRASRKPLSGAGNMQGRGTRKIVLHTSESDPGSINGVVSWVAKQRTGYHLVIDDKAKKAVQLYPFNKSARAMLHGFDPYGCNMQGKVAIQICIVGRAHNDPAAHLSKWARKIIVDIARSWDVPLVVRNNGRSKRTWVHRSGLYGHKNAVRNDHNDPGRIRGKKYWLRGLN